MSSLDVLLDRVRQGYHRWQDWLVLADWLSDLGDVRGELILLDHRLATEALSYRQKRKLLDRVQAIEAAHQDLWLSDLTVPEEASLSWLHGFVIGASLPWGDWTLGFLEDLAAHPTGRLIFRLDFQQTWLRPEGAALLARCPVLPEISELGLGSGYIRSQGLSVLARSGALRGLSRLDLGWNELGPEGASVLADVGLPERLASLDLEGNAIGPEGAAALARCGRVPLDRLVLRNNELGFEGVLALARWEALRGVTELDLSSNDIGGEGVIALVRAGVLGALTVLDLRDNGVGGRGREAAEALRGCRIVL